jgi:hypothetical protein
MASVNPSKNTAKNPAKSAAPPRQAGPADGAGTGAPGAFGPDRAARWGLLLVAALLGLAVGVFGSLGHRAEATWLGVGWPTGLVLAFCGLAGLLLGVSELLEPGDPRSWRPTRLSALGWAAVGWLVALLWLTYLGPPPSLARKGDAVLPNDWRSVSYLLGGMLLVTVFVYRAWAASLTARLAARPGAAGGAHPKG